MNLILDQIDNFLVFIQPSKQKRFKFIKKYLLFNCNVTSFLTLYHVLNLRTFFKFFQFVQQYNINSKSSFYKIYFNFRVNRFFVSVVNSKGRVYTSLSVGLFLKFFQNKKSLKKNKLFKLLLAKYLRKLLIIADIKNVYLYIRRTPTHIHELCTLLTSPLQKAFFNPITGLEVSETSRKHHTLDIRYIFFNKIKSFTNMKVCRRGRLKRKIQRRIIKSNRITD